MAIVDLPVAFRVNAPHVIAESVEGEVLIIHLMTGAYYSSGGLGDALWALIGEGATTDTLFAYVSARYDGDSDAMRGELLRWLDQLLAEELVVPATDLPVSPQPAIETRERSPFEPPILQKYTDMQDLLLLDPVHEVSEEGWPVAQRA